MSLLHYGIVLTLMLILFPMSVTQMKVALDCEEIESFSGWLLLTACVAVLPMMALALTIAS
ncbi:hypothetical protein AVDCRST_MAG81-785 [uncultured Synechococcales cyanobacterium]|uniref:Uncharacterized protein n=1 Tax=uncultured Synechococcales cyanobacterium TaxID=1936017 RepID=A0A6J4UZ88_9CYAN|nr:hypothetical protein AVDCRST_MAG81-785 [uncultured Synechococcales cyanobacterium]